MSEAPLENEIRKVCSEMADFLVSKNKAYGNSAAEPIGVFAKHIDTLAQIDVRIDDKLNRLAKGSEYAGDDTVKDLTGYLLLRMVVVKQEMDKSFFGGEGYSESLELETEEQEADRLGV